MSTTSKIAIGVGIASGALLAAWLLTGTRKEKTKKFISEKAATFKKMPAKVKPVVLDESEAVYV
jgi:hypothetical protein